VKRLPGPSRTRSASRIASRAGSWAAGSGSSQTRRQAPLPAAIRVSPQTASPSSRSDLLQRRGQHAAADLQDPAALLDRQVEAPRDLREGGEEEVAEGVSRQVAVGEAVLEEAAEERLVVGEGDEAIADVAGRQHPQLAAQPPGRAAVVGHGDDGRDVDRRRLEPAQQRGEAGAPAEGRDPRGPRRGPVAAESGRARGGWMPSAAHAAGSSTEGGAPARAMSRWETLTSKPAA
jgi:hypothetical protein